MGAYSERSAQLAGYLYGDLEPNEMEQIEREISRDPELAGSYRINVKVRDYLKAKVQLEEMRGDPGLEKAMRWAGQSAGSEDANRDRGRSLMGSGPRLSGIRGAGARIRDWRRPLYVAAALAAALALVLCLRAWMPQDPGKLYYSYYQPFEASDFTRRGDAEEKYRDVSDAIRSYLSGNYPETIRLFDHLASNPGLMPEVTLFRGLSYMGLGMFERAEIELERCLADGTRYRPEAMWYLALCKIRLEKYDQAGTLLGQLEYYAGMVGEDARELGGKIRRIRK